MTNNPIIPLARNVIMERELVSLHNALWTAPPLLPSRLFHPRNTLWLGIQMSKILLLGIIFFFWFLWKFDTPVGVKINPADTPVGVKIHPTDPSSPYPFRGKCPPPPGGGGGWGGGGWGWGVGVGVGWGWGWGGWGWGVGVGVGEIAGSVRYFFAKIWTKYSSNCCNIVWLH